MAVVAAGCCLFAFCYATAKEIPQPSGSLFDGGNFEARFKLQKFWMLLPESRTCSQCSVLRQPPQLLCRVDPAGNGSCRRNRSEAILGVLFPKARTVCQCNVYRRLH